MLTVDNDHPNDDDLPPLTAGTNYPSALEHETTLLSSYHEDVEEGLALGPYTPQDAASVCACTVPESARASGWMSTSKPMKKAYAEVDRVTSKLASASPSMTGPRVGAKST